MPSIYLLPHGLDNMHDPARLGKIADPRDPNLKVLVEAVNFDIDDNGVAHSRTGRTKTYSGTPHSFWTTPDGSKAYFAEAGVLKKFNTDGTATTLLTLNDDLPVCFEQVNDTIVFSDMIQLGYIVGDTAAWFTAPSTAVYDEFKALMPGAQYLTFYNGVLFAALGSIIYMSDGYNLGVMDVRFNQIPMPGYIRMLAAVEDGVWVASDSNVGFISGNTAEEFTFDFVSDAAPADGAFCTSYDDEGGRRVYWASTEGFCAGTAGGKYANLSAGKVALPSGSSGKLWLREENGQEHLVAIITDPTSGNTYVEDAINIDTQYS